MDEAEVMAAKNLKIHKMNLRNDRMNFVYSDFFVEAD